MEPPIEIASIGEQKVDAERMALELNANWVVLRIAYQRDPGSSLDRLRFPTLDRSDPEISSGKTPEPVKDRSDRPYFHEEFQSN